MQALISSLLGGPYGLLIKYGAILAVLLGLFGTGYYEGYKHEKVIYQSEIVNHVITQTKYVVQTEQPKEAAQQQKVKVVHDTQIQYVDKIVTVNPVCDLGSDAIGVLNSLRGTLSPQPR